MLRSVKRAARRLGSRLGLLALIPRNQRQHAAGTEMPSFYYDEAFISNTIFLVPFYQSPYYPTWLVVVDRLRRYACNSILDVGCGPGQFAALIDDAGFRSYTGLDFSTVAIEKAQARTPRFQFRVGDVRDPAIYEGLHADAIICMEVLEHIEDDFAVIACFPPGTRCLMTVPNFPWRSHVRHFSCEEEVIGRFGRFFDELAVTRIKGVRTDAEQFYLLDGIRNTIRSTDSPGAGDSTPTT